MLTTKNTPKGLGLFTNNAIKAGTRIIHEEPLAVVRAQSRDITDCSILLESELRKVRENSPEDYNDYIAIACNDKALSLEDKKAVLRGHGMTSFHFSSFPPTSSDDLPARKQAALIIKHLCILYTNAAELPESDTIPAGKAIYRAFSRANHSCTPNLIYYTSTETSERPWITICPIRDLAADEELTVAYVSPCDSTAERAAELARRYGFVCTCAACQGPQAAEHEAHRQKARAINAALRAFNDGQHNCGDDTWLATSQGIQVPETVDEALGLAKRCVPLVKETGLVGWELSKVYFWCLSYATLLGRSSEADHYLRGFKRVWEICEGIDGTDRIDNDKNTEDRKDSETKDDEAKEDEAKKDEAKDDDAKDEEANDEERVAMDPYISSDTSSLSSILDEDGDKDDLESGWDPESPRSSNDDSDREADKSEQIHDGDCKAPDI